MKLSFDRQRLPTPIDYYRRLFKSLRVRGNWSTVICPFHKDKNPSLSINLQEGHFRCHACGAKGGDIIAFEMQRTGLPFRTVMQRLCHG